MAPFAAGLLVYWTGNNILSIIQQYVIMHRFKAENPIDNLIVVAQFGFYEANGCLNPRSRPQVQRLKMPCVQ